MGNENTARQRELHMERPVVEGDRGTNSPGVHVERAGQAGEGLRRQCMSH